MSAIACNDEILHFKNHLSVELTYLNAKSYYKCRTYDAKLMEKGYVWHQVVVQHGGNCPGVRGRDAILKAIYQLAEGNEFYPVAYRRNRMDDRFLVRQCQPFLEKLFAENLCITLPNKILLLIQVQLNVAEYKLGQISPIMQISKTLNKLYSAMETSDGPKGILNLSRFNQNSELFDIIVNMGCRGVLERIFDLIYRNDATFRDIKGINLSDNGISTMSPFKLFVGVEFTLLDLRNNNLESYIRLNKDLQPIKAKELKLLGNPITQSPSYPEILRPIFKNFQLLDDVPTENISIDLRPSLGSSIGPKVGHRIDWSNKRDIYQFEKSTDWHSIMIPDAKQSYTKEEIMEYFFNGVSPVLSELYPCYYKYASGQHQFLVRKCFDQIKHLVKNCNLEIQIPRYEAPPPPTDTSTNYAPQLVMDTTCAYYILMNVSNYNKGQLDPMEALEKALNRRFSGYDRFMDLTDFQSAKGLENIIFMLSSEKILKRVLKQVSRLFTTTCIELCLARNKIKGVNYPKILQEMTNLKALDLSNNCIGSINDIKKLSALDIKSLRLDGNPLCNEYPFPESYIKAIKNHFTDLKKLDGVDVGKVRSMFTAKNYLCDVDAYNVVDEFITIYFQAFQSDKRKLLEMYTDKAIITLSCNYNPTNQSHLNCKRLARYVKDKRILLKKDEYSPPYSSMYVGHKHIKKFLKKFPAIEYDMLSFRTDCSMYTEDMVVITVNGCCVDKSLTKGESDIIMGFSRMFVLKAIKKKAGLLKLCTLYKITNEIYGVFNATPTQERMCFTARISNRGQNNELTAVDKENLLISIQEVLQLKTVWCSRILKDCNWDFEKALHYFVELTEKEEIPAVAFY